LSPDLATAKPRSLIALTVATPSFLGLCCRTALEIPAVVDLTSRPLRLHSVFGCGALKRSGKFLKSFVKQGRLAAIIYYNWTALPGFEAPFIFPCGALTNAGKLALGPM
jgi:hypothetical protein